MFSRVTQIKTILICPAKQKKKKRTLHLAWTCHYIEFSCAIAAVTHNVSTNDAQMCKERDAIDSCEIQKSNQA